MTFSLSNLIELVIALGLLNVWLFRSGLSTPFRGGAAKNLREEFKVYGLGDLGFRVIGALKISCALLLLAGLWVPALTLPAAGIITALMVGALVMHIKVKDPIVKSVPALTMLGLALSVVLLQSGGA